jgi:hypothetical protein
MIRAMSQENVELARRWYGSLPDLRDANPDDDQAFLGRAFREYLNEDWELRLPAGYPEGEPVFRGREGVTQLVVMLRDAFKHYGLWVAVHNTRRTSGTWNRTARSTNFAHAGSGRLAQPTSPHLRATGSGVVCP